MTDPVRGALSETLSHDFKDPSLLARALTHAGANAARSNERLEFLGDRVLGLVVADTLYRLYPEEDEGALTRRVHSLVRWEACARVGEEIGLWDHLILTRSEAAGGRSKGPILGSALEAVIAAIYLDGGMDAARPLIERFGPISSPMPPPTAGTPRPGCRNGVRARGKGAPIYNLKEQEGPDHAPHFVVEAKVSGFDPALGEGGSKRQAEQDAAAKLLAMVGP